jgi:lipopolysaccharide transport system permease protein
MPELSAPNYQVVIEPRRRWLRFDLRELWEYRDLLMLLVRRDWLARYQQTLLGPLWHFFQPLLTTAVFVIIFSRVAKIPTDGVPPPLFYLSGQLAWNYFSQSIITASSTFLTNHHLFSKVWFPRLVVPVAALTSNLAVILMQMIPFVLIAGYYGLITHEYVPTWRMLLLPLSILHVAVVSLGIGLWMASATAKYRDIVHLNQFIVQLWMFATPVIFPLSKILERFAWVAWINPMAVPVETFHWCLLGQGTLPPAMVATSVIFAVVLLITGIIAFQSAERSAIDNV